MTVSGGNITLGSTSQDGTIELYNNTSEYKVTLATSNSTSADYSLTLPTDDGDANQVLTTNGSGILSWTTVSGGGGGGMTNFIIEDHDGTEVTISNGKEMKIIGSGLTTNWTNTSNGSDGDPYDLTITIDAAQTGITSLLATNIKIGEDDETKIGFETENQINFYADGTNQLSIIDGMIQPVTDNDIDLGSSANSFKDAHIQGTATIGTVTATNIDGIIGTNTPAAGTFTTCDATTDFTVGSLIITDDQIQMTPSANDTVTISAASNGVLNIITVDTDGTTGDINITSDGKIKYRANDATGHIFDINGTNQLSIIDGMIQPVTDNDIDLGSSAKSFKDGYFHGTLNIDVDANADDITGDSATGRLTIGAGEDLNFYHGGTNSYIVNNNGNLIITSPADSDILIGNNAVANDIKIGNSVSTTTEIELNSILIDINAGSSGIQMEAAGTSQFVTGSGAANTASGNISLTTGTGGNNSSGGSAGGAGGNLLLTTGNGGTSNQAANNSGAGGNIIITSGTGGAGGADNANGGNAGDITIQAGDGGNNNGSGILGIGGDINIISGGGSGVGRRGVINITSSKSESDDTAITLNSSEGGLNLKGKNQNNNIYIENSPLKLEQISAPSTTTDKLYNVSGDLIWNGRQISSSFTDTPSGLDGTGSVAQTYVTRIGGEIITDMIIDLTGLRAEYSTGSFPAPRIVAENNVTSNTPITQITNSINGQIYKAELICLEDISHSSFYIQFMFSGTNNINQGADITNSNDGSAGFIIGTNTHTSLNYGNSSTTNLPFFFYKYEFATWSPSSTSTTCASNNFDSTSLSVNDASNIQVGMLATGSSIIGYTVVTAISGTTLTLSSEQSVALGANVNFQKADLNNKYIYITSTAQSDEPGTDLTAGKFRLKLYGIPV